jgi:hypothetical protein
VPFVKRHPTALASAVALLLSFSALITFALSSRGYSVQHVDLHDGGIWVTNDGQGLFGRINKPAGALDAALNPPGGARNAFQLDVSQDGSAVVARDVSQGKLLPVDVQHAKALGEAAIAVQSTDLVQLTGGTLAIVRPSSGKVWATRVSPDDGLVTLAAIDPATATPVATLPRGSGHAALAVALNGTIFAANTSGATVTVRPSGAGFAKPSGGSLSGTYSDVQATAVGSTFVVMDPTTGRGATASGRSLTVPDVGNGGLDLQQAGPDDSAVLVATPGKLLSIGLSDGKPTVLSTAGTGSAPAAPVRLGTCIYGAWSGTPGAYVRACDGGRAVIVPLQNFSALTSPVFRMNHQSLVLNDVATGAVWDVDNQRRVDDWKAVNPPPVKDDSDKSKNQNVGLNTPKKPNAHDDEFGARPGRATVLHVLDNDSDPAGQILSVVGVSGSSNPAADLQIAPDGQAVVATIPQAGGDVSFTYTVNDGLGPNATAHVIVHSRGQSDEQPPTLRQGFRDQAWSVASGGHLTLPVMADWRDPDGDPIALVDASSPAGSVTTSQDGRINYTAPANGGNQTITYQVSDGLGGQGSDSVTVSVAGPDDTRSVAPVAQPDVAQGQVGQPIVIHPLDNDLPGADPATPTAQLAIAAAVSSPSGTTVDTDVRTGTVTVATARAGTYQLSYRASFGNAPIADGKIRVDVKPASAGALAPVAMPDVAVLHGQAPATVDVLANDYDASGGVLAVQSATATSNSGQLQVAVVKGRWVRIKALTSSLPTTPLVHYIITDGRAAPVTGEIAIRQLGPVLTDTPVPQDDFATVRAGDSANVPVLDNDTDPGGDPISLTAKASGAAFGQLPVSGPDGTRSARWGTAYVSGNRVRYVAPAATTQQNVQVDYVAQDPAGDQAVGHLHVTIVPLEPADQPPVPLDLEQRAVAGDTITIPVPTSGVDPDGDSVTVTGIGSAPTLGRISKVGMSSLTYLAYPTSSGTDSFTYVVTDRFGKTGSATIRIAVVPPGEPQPPVAVDDTVMAAPGTQLSIDVLQNDLIAPDDAVTITPLAVRNPGLARDTKLFSAQGPIDVTAPTSGRPYVVNYALTDGLSSPSTGVLTVHTEDKYDIPPVAVDVDAKPGPRASSVVVDVLAQDSDPDGSASDLTISHVFATGATTLEGGKVRVPVLGYPQTIAYEIKDAGGATAAAVIHVPAVGTGAPFATPDQQISIPKDGSKTVDIVSFVTDPAGKPVRLTVTRNIWASPTAGVAVRNSGDKSLVLTGHPGYVGPAAITFEVTDGTSLTDPKGLTAVITVPVQVGPPTPVLRCPANPLQVVAGGNPIAVDVMSVCHVWSPTADASGLRFSGSWKVQPGGLSLSGSGSGTLAVSAAGSAAPGSVGALSVTATGTDSAPANLSFQVVAAPPPSIAPITVDGIKAGTSTTMDLRGYVTSPLRDAAITVRSVGHASGDAATASSAGSSVTLTPDGKSHGTITFTVSVSDVTNASSPGRQVTGQITLHVLGVPDAPTGVQPGRTVLSKSVVLTWTAPANNGAPIDGYEVDTGAGIRPCTASPCTITGLTNGTTYSFRVRAHNAVDWGEWSGPSGPAKPNAVPGAVTNVNATNPQDGSLTLTWGPATNEGTAITSYDITWTGGGHSSVAGGATSAPISGLDNDTEYTFTVIPVNSQGPGTPMTTTGQSAGNPLDVAAPTLTSDSSAAATRAVHITWAAATANGKGPVTYTVTRTGGNAGTQTLCTDTQAAECEDDSVANDGTTYTYTVVAKNFAGHTATGPGATVEASATPGPVTNFTATPTGNDGEAHLTFDAPASYGPQSTVICTINGSGSCGSWSFPTGGQPGVNETIEGLPNGTAVSISLRDNNGSRGGNGAGSADGPTATYGPLTAFGPIRQPSISPPQVSGQAVTYIVSVDPNGKAAVVHVQSARTNTTYSVGGPDSRSFTDTIDWNSPDNISVTVSDSGRASMTATAGAHTGAAPPPPPPAQKVNVWMGADAGKHSDCDTTCNYIHVQTIGFSSSVHCSFNSSDGPGGWEKGETYGPNESKDSYYYFGYGNGWVEVTCGGIPSGHYNWPP